MSRDHLRPGRLPAHGARMQDADAIDGASDYVMFEAAPYRLDLGQLRHASVLRCSLVAAWLVAWPAWLVAWLVGSPAVAQVPVLRGQVAL